MSITYLTVPTFEQFKRDSSVRLAIRSQDQMLHAIDRLLERLQKSDKNRAATLGDLFFTCNSWIKAFHAKDKRIEKGRYDAILGLFDVVAKELMPMLGAGNLQNLTRALTEAFGLQNQGTATDEHFTAKIFDEHERETTRLRIQAGAFYRYMFDVSKSYRGLQIVNTYDFEVPPISRPGVGEPLRHFAGFVMSMDREFYMAQHWVPKEGEKGGVFHSAYFDGPVAMAGTMLIESGRLKGIRGDSGHYRPDFARTGMPNMANALRALRSKGVNLRGVIVYDYKSDKTHGAGRAIAKSNALSPNIDMLSSPPRGIYSQVVAAPAFNPALDVEVTPELYAA